MASAAAASVPRVLVHLKPSSTSTAAQALFSQSIVDSIFDNKDDVNDVYIDCEFADRKLLLGLPSDKGFLLRRPPFCPIKNLTEEQKSEIPKEILNRGVNVGIVALLESSDQRVLVTTDRLRSCSGRARRRGQSDSRRPSGSPQLRSSVGRCGARQCRHHETSCCGRSCGHR